jgi:hypothetical protein
MSGGGAVLIPDPRQQPMLSTSTPRRSSTSAVSAPMRSLPAAQWATVCRLSGRLTMRTVSEIAALPSMSISR